MFKKLLLKVYNATVSEITLQASSGSVDYEFAKTVKKRVQSSRQKFVEKCLKHLLKNYNFTVCGLF